MGNLWESGHQDRDRRRLQRRTPRISENDYAKLTEDALISVNDEEYPVASVAGNPIRMSESEEGTDDYFLHLSGFETSNWVYEISADADDLEDGIYRVSVVLERVKPMDFVLN